MANIPTFIPDIEADKYFGATNNVSSVPTFIPDNQADNFFSNQQTQPEPATPYGHVFGSTLDNVEQKAKDTYGENSLGYAATLPARAVLRTGAAVGDFLSGATQKFGETAGSAFAAPHNVDLYSQAQQTQSDAITGLQKSIREAKARGVDTSHSEMILRKMQNEAPVQLSDFTGTDTARRVNETFGQNLKEVGGQALGTVLEATAGGLPKFYKPASIASGSFKIVKPVVQTAEEIAKAKQAYKALPFLAKAKQAGVEGLKQAGIGAGYGEVMDISQNLQNQESGTDIFTKGSNKYVGAGLGVALPLAFKGISATYKAGSKLGKATGIFDSSVEDVAKARSEILDKYKKSLPLTPTQQKYEAQSLEKTGDNVYTTYVKHGINLGSDEAPTQLQNVSDSFEQTINNAKNNEKAYFNVAEIKKNAHDQIDQNLSSETERQAAKNKVDTEIDAIIQSNPNSVIQHTDGSMRVNSDLVERLRKTGNTWGQYNKLNPDTVKNATGRSLANAVRDQVEKEGTFPSYRDANKEWGKVIHAQEVLDNIIGSNKQWKVRGGLSGSIARKVLSGVLGYHTAGLGGAVLGEIGSEFGVKIASNPEFRTFFERKIVENAGKKQTPETITKLAQEIKDYLIQVENRPRLSGPQMDSTTVTSPQGGISRTRYSNPIPQGNINAYGGVELPTPERKSGISIIPAQKNPVSVNPQTGKFQTSYSSSVEPAPIKTQSSIIPSKIPISPTIPPKLKNVNILPKVKGETPNKLEPLAQEAKKYKSAEEFVRAKTKRPDYGYGHSPNENGVRAFDLTEKVDGEQMIPKDMYTKWYGSRGTKSDLESIAVLKKIKGNPEADVTIYRAAPKEGFNYGDWVTLSKDYARQHAEGNNFKVFSQKVKAKDIRWAMDDVNEFGYFPESTKSQLTDIYNKAVGEKKLPLLPKKK